MLSTRIISELFFLKHEKLLCRRKSFTKAKAYGWAEQNATRNICSINSQ
jgi:hypothetical protein